MDSIDDMILLAEVAEAGSFTQGGLRLGMPKSTVSQRLQQLEARLGLRLLNRSTRHVSLTAAGQVYLDYCRRIRDEAAAATIAMGNLKEQPTGTLRITCPEITASHFMPEFLRGFSTAFPAIDIDLIATNRHIDLILERVDFAFRVGPVSGQDLILSKLSLIRRVLVASPAHLRTHPPLATPEALLQHRCLVHSSQPDWEFSAGEARCVLRVPPAIRSDSMGFLLQSAVAGGGVALLPAYVCCPAMATGQLVAVLPEWEIPPSALSLVMASLKNQSRIQAAFHSFVTRYDFSALTAADVPI